MDSRSSASMLISATGWRFCASSSSDSGRAFKSRSSRSKAITTTRCCLSTRRAKLSRRSTRWRRAFRRSCSSSRSMCCSITGSRVCASRATSKCSIRVLRRNLPCRLRRGRGSSKPEWSGEREPMSERNDIANRRASRAAEAEAQSAQPSAPLLSASSSAGDHGHGRSSGAFGHRPLFCRQLRRI